MAEMINDGSSRQEMDSLLSGICEFETLKEYLYRIKFTEINYEWSNLHLSIAIN